MANDGLDGPFMAEAERTLLAPIRSLLIEGSDAGELRVEDPAEGALMIVGAVTMVATMRTLAGDFDPSAVADRLIPQVLDGLRI
jgi:hypothetical protein